MTKKEYTPFKPAPYQEEVFNHFFRMTPAQRARLELRRPRYVTGVDLGSPEVNIRKKH